MNKQQTTKIVIKVATGWASFRYWVLPEDARQGVVAGWHEQLKTYEFDAVEKVIDGLISATSNDPRFETAPDLKTIVRKLSLRSDTIKFHRASAEFKSDYGQMLQDGGFVWCEFVRRDGTKVSKWEKKEHAVFDGASWWPKIELILHHLPEAHLKFRGIGIHRVAGNREQAARYLVFREKLLDQAIALA